MALRDEFFVLHVDLVFCWLLGLWCDVIRYTERGRSDAVDMMRTGEREREREREKRRGRERGRERERH